MILEGFHKEGSPKYTPIYYNPHRKDSYKGPLGFGGNTHFGTQRVWRDQVQRGFDENGYMAS